MTATPIWLLFMGAVMAICYSMWLFDCLVRWEHTHHRDKWESDGRPDGYFWRPDRKSGVSSDLAKKRLGFVWIFRAPDWMLNNPETRRWLIRMRVTSGLFIAVGLLLLARQLFHILSLIR